jgi:deoxyhypusine synthase
MLVTLAGAMSTAELGISLAEMIRQGKVHAISCTGANLEEDLFHLVACEHYVNVSNWRDLSPQDDHNFWEKHLNRVTDVCIPEAEAFRVLEGALDESWRRSEQDGERLFPHEHLYRIIREGTLKDKYQKDPASSWLVAAAETNLPMFVPGFEDSTTGNLYAGRILLGELSPHTVKNGSEYMVECMKWYMRETASLGMFQIGGGIAGDFVACVVPTIRQDFRGIFPEVPLWGYHCQICDSTTSYGSFSGCTPSEKISWGKLAKDTPNFVIESDATIVAPLIFAYVLGE